MTEPVLEPLVDPVPRVRTAGVDTALVVSRVTKTLAAQLNVDDETARKVALRIAEGVQRLWQVEFNKLGEELSGVEDELDLARVELEDLAEWEDLIRQWHYTQSDHPGWAVCQHQLCAQVRR